jgi:hypothetical protein
MALALAGGAVITYLLFRNHDTETGFLGLIGSLVVIGFVSFLVYFVWPWLHGQRILRTALEALKRIEARASHEGRSVTDLQEIGEVFRSPLLEHQWTEFEDTLHPQQSLEEDEYGTRRVERYRQTVPAEMFFSYTSLVEVPLRTEFFKHLPGILTGLGIIGTFLGLIVGLGQFDVAQATQPGNDATDVLIDSVYKAFFVSLLAIASAMVITAFEKGLLNAQMARVTHLCETLDHLFDAGAGEEYLSRLVQASEESATQTTQLKDALVSEISEVLERMTRMQIEALREAGAAQTQATRESALVMAETVATQIKETFEEPLLHVAKSIDETNRSTQERVGSLLEDLLAQFSQQVESMFGDQIGELTTLLQETSGMMQSTISRFEQLGHDIEGAGRRAASSMAAELQTQVAAIAMQLGGEMARIVEQVQGATSEVQAQLLDGQKQLNDATRSTLDELHTQLAASNEATVTATRDMQSTVASLTESTQDAMERFEAGTRRLETAVGKIYQSAMELAGNLKAASEIVSQLRDATTASEESLAAAKKLVDRMGKGTEQLSEALATVQTILENAQRDAQTTSDLVAGIESSSAALTRARTDTTDFLSTLEDALVKAHDDFGRQVERSLNTTTKVFHQDLETATRQLSGIVKELGDVLDDLMDNRVTA